MKARPLSKLPKLQRLSKELATLRKLPLSGDKSATEKEGTKEGKWNIGIHPVMYRDNRDSMGDHADDDQVR